MTYGIVGFDLRREVSPLWCGPINDFPCRPLFFLWAIRYSLDAYQPLRVVHQLLYYVYHTSLAFRHVNQERVFSFRTHWLILLHLFDECHVLMVLSEGILDKYWMPHFPKLPSSMITIYLFLQQGYLTLCIFVPSILVLFFLLPILLNFNDLFHMFVFDPHCPQVFSNTLYQFVPEVASASSPQFFRIALKGCGSFYQGMGKDCCCCRS